MLLSLNQCKNLKISFFKGLVLCVRCWEKSVSKTIVILKLMWQEVYLYFHLVDKEWWWANSNSWKHIGATNIDWKSRALESVCIGWKHLSSNSTWPEALKGRMLEEIFLSTTHLNLFEPMTALVTKGLSLWQIFSDSIGWFRACAWIARPRKWNTCKCKVQYLLRLREHITTSGDLLRALKFKKFRKIFMWDGIAFLISEWENADSQAGFPKCSGHGVVQGSSDKSRSKISPASHPIWMTTLPYRSAHISH